jgi:hypothetical protein
MEDRCTIPHNDGAMLHRNKLMQFWAEEAPTLGTVLLCAARLVFLKEDSNCFCAANVRVVMACVKQLCWFPQTLVLLLQFVASVV